MGDKSGELKGSIGNEKLDVLFGLMDQRCVAIVREGTATMVNLDESGATYDGNPKVISSHLVSPTATLIMAPRGPYDIDVAVTFRVPVTTVGDRHMLINDIEAGKHDDLLSEMTNDDRIETLDALGTICNSIQADKNVILNESNSMPKGVPSVKDPNDPNADDNMPGMVSPSDLIVLSIDINTKSTSYAGAVGASAKDQPKVISNFRSLVADLVFDGANISIPRKVAERSNFARCLIEVSSEADLVDVVTIGILSLIREDFTKETIRIEYELRPPKCDKRKGKSKSNNGGQFAGHSVKQTVRYEPKATINTPKEGTTNKEEDEEEVENVYDETTNLFTKTGRSSFTAAAEIESLHCPSCYTGIESIDHIFFTCLLAKEVWRLIFRWGEFSSLQLHSFSDCHSWLSSFSGSKIKCDRLLVIIAATCWTL
nr:RNA-directed DNA polymerase, eukaryota [Tanacetum cinerariifolium]